jgi:hypothetical protein
MGVTRKVFKGMEFAAGLAGCAGWDGVGFDPERVRMGADWERIERGLGRIWAI